MKCEKCGGSMKKVNEKTMKCAGCGAFKNIEEENKEESK